MHLNSCNWWRPTYRESLWSCLRESLMFLRQLSLLVS